jgi:hypothetical protein
MRYDRNYRSLHNLIIELLPLLQRLPTHRILPNMQKAVFVHEIGKPVRLGERPIPSPKVGEVLVKVTATQGA